MGLTGKVVFSSGRAVDFDIWSLDLKTGRLAQLTRGPHFNDHPRWSPDGSKIVFTRTEDDSVSSIWVMDPDGGNQRRVTQGIYCQTPSWHPDGKTIIFSGNGGDRQELSVCSISLDGSDLTMLFDAPGIEVSPTFTPDGECILFAAPEQRRSRFSPVGVTDIMEYRTRSGELRSLHSHPAHDFGPVCSPDGERIAFISSRNGESVEEHRERFEQYRNIVCNGTNAEAREAMARMKKSQADGDIYVSNRDGTRLIQLTEDRYSDRSICWSPCGNFIMYTRTELGESQTDRLYVIDSHSGDPVELSYDRGPLESAIEADRVLNRTLFSKLTPDAFERLCFDSSFWGAERNPDWTR